MTELGIGAAHDGATPTVRSLTGLLRTALMPATRARAFALAGSIGTEGAGIAARLLTGSAATGRS